MFPALWSWSALRDRLPAPAAILALLVPELALLVGAAIRIAHRPAVDFDEHIFLNVGAHIVSIGRPLDTVTNPHLFFDHTPLYVYFAALLTAFGGHTVLLLRAASLAFAMGTVALLFLSARALRGPISGFVGAMLLATNPFFITYSWFVRMEVPLCFFVMLAVYLLIEERLFLAGLAIAAAVMLKEVALAFWLVAVVYVAARRGLRAAATVGIATPIAFFGWLVYAAFLDFTQLTVTVDRWLRSGFGDEASNPRFHIDDVQWARIIATEIVGPVIFVAAGVAAVLGAKRHDRVPGIGVLAAGYAGVAVVTSFVISLKEPRYLIAILPMLAFAVALLIDWDKVWAGLRTAPRRTRQLPA
jgi:4-amino-4-deoxy-L-arabinose transferase-like glycosyltransferase